MSDTIADVHRAFSVSVALQQIGTATILAVSGGRVRKYLTGDGYLGLSLPVHAGYSVRVALAADDTYTVRRVFSRSGKEYEHGTERGVYCDQLSDTVYRASCYVNVPFGGITP